MKKQYTAYQLLEESGMFVPPEGVARVVAKIQKAMDREDLPADFGTAVAVFQERLETAEEWNECNDFTHEPPHRLSFELDLDELVELAAWNDSNGEWYNDEEPLTYEEMWSQFRLWNWENRPAKSN